MSNRQQVFLSPPHPGKKDAEYVADALASNWLTTAGPHLDAFENELAAAIGAAGAVALASGTAGLHLALHLLGVGPGDEVFVSTLTFAASAFPIRYLGATPVFIDSERKSWNMDPDHLASALEAKARAGRLPSAVIVVHLYGQTADLARILPLCAQYEVPVVEDAAQALGTRHGTHGAGTLGHFGVFSFNGNKIITTSGGGMLVSNDRALVDRARKLSLQAREITPHYQHNEIGFNYRLSNVLAAIGRSQLLELDERLKARRRNFARYRDALTDLPGIDFMPEAPWNRHSRWLTTLTIDSALFGADRITVSQHLDRNNIESRPVMKPMHLQPAFAGCECFGGDVAEDLFVRGLCLPSGSSLSTVDLERVVQCIRGAGSERSGRRFAR